VTQLTNIILNLKDEILKQNRAISELKEGQEEAKKGQIRLESQNKALQNQIAELKKEVQNARVTPTTTTPSAGNWAVVAARGGTATAAATRAPNLDNTQPRNGPTTLRIYTSLVPSSPGVTDQSFTRYMSADKATTCISKALQANDATKEAQVAGVGSTKLGYLIRFKDEKSKELAYKNDKWVHDLGTDTRVIKPRYGVVVHRTPTEEVQIQQKVVAISKIASENDLLTKGHQIEEIAWLRKKDTPLGRSASLGIWFTTQNAAEWAIQDGLLFGQRYIGSIEQYEMKRKRCFSCQSFGHLAWNCKGKKRCGHCCGEHDKRECPPNTTAKCVDCSKSHPTDSAECRERATSLTQ